MRIPETVQAVRGAVKELMDRFDGPKLSEEEISETLDRIARSKGSSDLILARDDKDRIVGMLTIHFLPDLDRFSFINNLMVAKEYESNGVAKELLRRAEDMSRERGMKLISVDIDRDAPLSAIRLYGCAGYVRNESFGHHKYL
jgi:GNAT superfamily N-acetyltransferase